MAVRDGPVDGVPLVWVGEGGEAGVFLQEGFDDGN